MSQRWWSQPFAPEGSAAAEGIAKQLGRPTLDPLTTLVRESAQNSWDARTGQEEVSFHVSVRSLGGCAPAWREALMPAPHPDARVDLDPALKADSHLIVVSDRGTVGLGGPVRAGQRAGGDERSDFVQFLRNVGEPSEHALGGGTYGFGKSILYGLSSASTILVDTSTVAGRGPQRRLMAATLGHSWHLGEQRYTGRHWWGQIAADNVPDPVLDHDAAELAERLGLPGFDDGRTGTDIAILGADLGWIGEEGELRARSRAEAATVITSSILWHLWPKAVAGGEGVGITFSVDVDGRDLLLPSPGQVPDLRPFVEALMAVRAGQGQACTRTVPPRSVGTFALALSGAATGAGPTRQMVTAARPFEGASHHVVRMRDAELVVDYLPGPLHPDPLLCYGAVFKASTEADPHFAAAEPPTHDDWIDKGLAGTTRGVVQGARRFVVKQLEVRLGMRAADGSGHGGLGALAARLSALLPLPSETEPAGSGPGHPDGAATGGSSGTSGSGGQGSDGGGRPRDAARSPRLLDPPRLYLHEGVPFLGARLALPASSLARTIHIDVLVVTQGGGVEGEPPLGQQTPGIDQWEQVGGGLRHHGPSLTLPSGEASEWWVTARHIPDVVVRFHPRQVDHHGE